MDFEEKALLYAEKYGIVEYQVKGGVMSYEETFRGEGTYNCRVDLNTMKEKRKLKKGEGLNDEKR